MGRPANPLLNNIVLVVVFAALVGAAWAGYAALVVLLGLALSAGLLAKLWGLLCLKAVTCERRLGERRVFPGEEVEMTLRLVNGKLLPLPWIEMRDELPTALMPITSLELTERPGYVSLCQSTPMLWYSAAVFTHQLHCSTRGYYTLGPLSITSGDIFGLHRRTSAQTETDHLLIYPRIYTLTELGIPSLSHLGDAKSDLRIFDDPSRLTGVREYSPGDSPRRIHWKASARRRTLQVKLYEYTTDVKVAVFLAVDTFADGSPDDLELAISTAASVTRHLLERNVQTGLFTNSRLADTGRSARVAPSRGVDQLAVILEALAKATREADGPFIDFFERERIELGFGGTIALVVGTVPAALKVTLADLRRTGRRVLVLQLGEQSRESGMTGVQWHHVRRPAAQYASPLLARGATGATPPGEAEVA